MSGTPTITANTLPSPGNYSQDGTHDLGSRYVTLNDGAGNTWTQTAESFSFDFPTKEVQVLAPDGSTEGAFDINELIKVDATLTVPTKATVIPRRGVLIDFVDLPNAATPPNTYHFKITGVKRQEQAGAAVKYVLTLRQLANAGSAQTIAANS
jgi:hypothetical protein